MGVGWDGTTVGSSSALVTKKKFCLKFVTSCRCNRKIASESSRVSQSHVSQAFQRAQREVLCGFYDDLENVSKMLRELTSAGSYVRGLQGEHGVGPLEFYLSTLVSI